MINHLHLRSERATDDGVRTKPHPYGTAVENKQGTSTPSAVISKFEPCRFQGYVVWLSARTASLVGHSIKRRGLAGGTVRPLSHESPIR